MSAVEKKVEDQLENLEKGINKKVKVFNKKVHQRNLFPLIAGGVAVFFLMVSMVVVAPYMFLLDVPPSTTAHEYTDLQARGRSLYMSMGCFYCHSQQVRLYDWGIGNISQEGDYVYDSPHALGTERTGPDLAQIGGMRPTIWHALHDRDPRSVSPGSIMPNFVFLTDNEIEALTAYIQNLGQENLQVEASITNGSAYHPSVPANYANATNPYSPTMALVLANYDVANDVYNGDQTMGDQWASIFDAGKAEFTKLCLACHGCSGNAQGPYARHVVTQPANLNERIATFPNDAYHIWRVSEGVPGTAMPAWALTLNSTEIRLVAIYEQSFVFGSARTFDGVLSDAEGDNYANTVLNAPPIAGTMQDFENGKNVFNLYCAQCHGAEGHGDGPASTKTPGGYISPVPANFTESGRDFQLYGRYVWKVKEGVETTNMPPWKYALNDNETYQAIFYIQSFATADDYNSKWGPQYSDSFARNLKSTPATASIIPSASNLNPIVSLSVLAGIVLWNVRYSQLMEHLDKTRLKMRIQWSTLRRPIQWT